MGHLLLKMSIPQICAQLVNLLYLIVDRMYIGHIPGEGAQALAGIGVTGSVIMLISAFASFVSGGAAPLTGIALGQGNRDEAGKLLGNGMSFLLISGLCLSVPVYFLMEPLLKLVGASSVTLPFAKAYLEIYLLGTFFVMTASGLNPFIALQGHPLYAMLSVLTGAGLNLLLDPLCIFTFGMGVRGAALATVGSQAVSAVMVFHFLTSEKASLRLEKRHMYPEKRVIQRILSLGIAPFVMGSTESLIGFVMNGQLVKFGDVYVSALTVMQSAMQFVSAPLNGFGQGVSPVISYNFGHGDRKRVVSAVKIQFSIMCTFTFVLFLLMILFPGVVAGCFTDDRVLLDTVEQVMPVFLLGMTIFGMQRACQNTFVATGQAGISLFIALLRKVILLIPLALVLPHFLDEMGVFWAEAIADGTCALLCMCLFLWRFPKILRSIDTKEVKPD